MRAWFAARESASPSVIAPRNSLLPVGARPSTSAVKQFAYNGCVLGADWRLNCACANALGSQISQFRFVAGFVRLGGGGRKRCQYGLRIICGWHDGSNMFEVAFSGGEYE